MSTKALNLDIKTYDNFNFRIHVDDEQVPELCLGLMMLKYELIETLQLSQQVPLRIRKLTKKLKNKWNVQAGYATNADSTIDLRLDENFIEGLLQFYLQYHLTNHAMTVNQSDFWFYPVEKKQSVNQGNINYFGCRSSNLASHLRVLCVLGGLIYIFCHILKMKPKAVTFSSIMNL